jgi:cob(I)alamin adenosyltransferase
MLASLKRLEDPDVTTLEGWIDRLEQDLAPLTSFVLPGGTVLAAQLHLARTVCRRAERQAVALARDEPVGPFVVKYLNRLSDALFVMARYENLKRGISDILWNSRA